METLNNLLGDARTRFTSRWNFDLCDAYVGTVTMNHNKRIYENHNNRMYQIHESLTSEVTFGIEWIEPGKFILTDWETVSIVIMRLITTIVAKGRIFTSQQQVALVRRGH